MDNTHKLDMHTKDKSQENFEKLKALFPNAVTETIKDAKIVRAIDKDVLMQEISAEVVAGKDERYQFTWPDKKQAVLLANSPTTKTLRPCKEESVNFDSTKNLYIEGDNLEVLKLLQETYLGKVKMIYIDPPYNTGKDSFVYDDKRTTNAEEYKDMAATDEDGNLVYDFRGNAESNGYFHTDWLNMMYPRLRLARDLLTDDGVIFISIDDNEVSNLKKICDEIFGENNFITSLIWNKQHSQQQGIFKKYHEVILLYAKNINLQKNISCDEGIIDAGAQKKISKANPASKFTFPKGVRFEAQDGTIITGEFGNTEKSKIIKGQLKCRDNKTDEEVTIEAGWTQRNQMYLYFYSDEEVIDTKGQKVIEFYFTSTGKLKCKKEKNKITPPTILPEYGMVSAQTEKLSELMSNHVFDTPKPIMMIVDFLTWFTHKNNKDIILDFFSGSATTAHAVMQLNAEDEGKRQFIMVQLPEVTDGKSEAYKAGYKNICEIGKERIRRAGKKILQENSLTENDLDIGFRVLKLDSTNMKDVYYVPAQYNRSLMQELETNIKEDRSAEDLLFQVLLDLGIELSCTIETTTIQNKTLYNVNANFLIACFDTDLSEEIITEAAKQKPQYAVFRDSSLSSDTMAVNFEQIFKTYSPETVTKVL